MNIYCGGKSELSFSLRRFLLLALLTITILIPSTTLGVMDINVTKTVVPENLLACEDATIWINVSATGEPTTIYKPICGMLVIDTSGSMDNNPDGPGGFTSVLQAVQQATTGFVGKINTSKDCWGVVSYDTEGDLRRSLTASKTQLNSTINGLSAGGFTNIEDGLEEAGFETNQELSRCGIDADCKCGGDLPCTRVMIVFTDGVPNRAGNTGGTTCDTCPTTNTTCVEAAKNEATQQKNAGIIIFTVSYLTGISEGCSNPATVTVARNLMKSIASKPEYAYEAASVSELAGIYDNISKEINEMVAADLLVVDYAAPEIILTAGEDPQQFSLDSLNIGEWWNISIPITSNTTGTFATNDKTTLNFTYSNGSVQNWTVPSPTLNVQLPVTLEKTAPEEVVIGEEFNYTIELEHIGNLDISNMTIYDKLCDNVTYVSHSCTYIGSGNPGDFVDTYYPGSKTLWVNSTGPSLKGGDRIICNITVYVNDDVEYDTISNEVKAFYDRSPCIIAQAVTDTTELKIKKPNFTIIKTAESEPSPATPGTKINFTIWINNTGNVNLTQNSVEDLLEGIEYTLPSPSGDNTGPGFLNVSENWSYEFNITVTEDIGDICDGWINNSVEGNFSYMGKKEKIIVKKDWANVTTDYTADFDISKTAEYEGYPLPAIPGTKINYTIWINNTGNVNLTNIDVTDSLYPTLLAGSKTGDYPIIGVLNISENWKYAFNITLENNPDPWINNTVTANFTDPCGSYVNRSAFANISTTVCQTADAGDDAIVCAGVNASLVGNATGADSVGWSKTVDCDGTLYWPLAGQSQSNASYKPISGDCNLTFTAYGPCPDVSDNATVWAVANPIADIKVIEPARYKD